MGEHTNTRTEDFVLKITDTVKIFMNSQELMTIYSRLLCRWYLTETLERPYTSNNSTKSEYHLTLGKLPAARIHILPPCTRTLGRSIIPCSQSVKILSSRVLRSVGGYPFLHRVRSGSHPRRQHSTPSQFFRDLGATPILPCCPTPMGALLIYEKIDHGWR